QQCAGGCVLAVVDRRSGADRGEQLVVLGLVHIAARAPVHPVLLAVAIVDPGLRPVLPAPAEDVAESAGAEDVVLDLVGGATPVPAVVVTANVFGILVDAGEVVVDIPIHRTGTALAAAAGPALHRGLVAQGPGHRVDAVNRLLDDVV